MAERSMTKWRPHAAANGVEQRSEIIEVGPLLPFSQAHASLHGDDAENDARVTANGDGELKGAAASQKLYIDEQDQQPDEARTQSRKDLHVNLVSDNDDDLNTVNENCAPSKQPNFDDLLFDLLFAANLSVYSNEADLGSASQVGVFIGFFGLLWWSWWSQTLFDARYRGREHGDFVTQAVQRIIRIALLGVWIAFATITSEFARSSYTNFITIYVSSRGLLALDHIFIAVRSFYSPLRTRDEHVPGVMDRRKHKHFNPLVSHAIMVSALVISIVVWVSSSYISSSKTLPPSVIGMWLAGIGVEVISEVIVEHNFALRSLSITPVVERMALLMLIIFGSGFERIGSALNRISPGNRDWSRGGIAFGGWGSNTVLNACASIAIVLLLFFSYFTQAAGNFEAKPVRILLWSYVHLVLQVSGAVLMIVLGRTILFVNSLSALYRFIESPQLYLPDTPDWTDYIQNDFLSSLDLLNLDSIPANASYYDRGTLAIIMSTMSLDGAEIPSVDVALALLNSTIPFGSVSLSTTLKSNLQQYEKLVESFQTLDGMDKYFNANVFGFYYAYLCPAIFLLADVAARLLQHYPGRHGQPMRKKLKFSLGIRVFVGLLLIAIQGIYLSNLNSSADSADNLLNGLILLACLLLLESLLQMLCKYFSTFVKAWRRFINAWKPRRCAG